MALARVIDSSEKSCRTVLDEKTRVIFLTYSSGPIKKQQTKKRELAEIHRRSQEMCHDIVACPICGEWLTKFDWDDHKCRTPIAEKTRVVEPQREKVPEILA